LFAAPALPHWDNSDLGRKVTPPPEQYVPPLTACTPVLCGRHCDFEAWDDVDRGNKLPHDPADFLEYAVMGSWKRREGDEFGCHGTWYMTTDEMVEALGKEKVDEALDAYEATRTKARIDAMAKAMEAAERPREEADDDA
jgi:hypothetical protein